MLRSIQSTVEENRFRNINKTLCIFTVTSNCVQMTREKDSTSWRSGRVSTWLYTTVVNRCIFILCSLTQITV